MLWDQYLHAEGEGSPTVCRAEECPFCPRFSKLDAEISKTRLILADLSRKRGELKIQINHHHKPYINRLPFELISQIFIEIVREHRPVDPLEPCYFGDFPIPPRLGAVCKMWREVTLATPRLWTTVIFRVKFCGCQYPYKIDVAKEWFRRSRSLPLTINIAFMDCQTKMCPLKNSKNHNFDSPVDLLRSHSTRWSRIRIHSQSNHPQLLHKLLENVPNQPTDLECLSLETCVAGSSTFDKKHALLPRSIYQVGCHSRSNINIVGVWDIPCGFERLMHMEMDCVSVNKMYHVLRNAPNLRKFKITLNNGDIDDVDTFPLPTTPIVVQRLTHLKTSLYTALEDSEFFSYLTLPSLQNLDYEYHGIWADGDLNDLVRCFKRSSPPLQTFELSITIEYPEFGDWYEHLPDVTSFSVNLMELRYVPETPNRCVMTEDFLAALARRSGTSILPRIQSLSLVTPGMSDASWASLCDMFTEERWKVLKNVEIYAVDGAWERNFVTEARVFEVFEGLKNAGVRLKVDFGSFAPKFGSSVSTSEI